MSDGSEKTSSGSKTIWIAVAAVVIVLGGAGAWFMLGKGSMAHKGAAAGNTQSARAEAAPGGTCGTALARVRDYGVVPYNATLSGGTAGTQADNGRIACAAESDGKNFKMLVDVSCDDMSNPKCLEIYRVTQGDGNALFQKRPYSF